MRHSLPALAALVLLAGAAAPSAAQSQPPTVFGGAPAAHWITPLPEGHAVAPQALMGSERVEPAPGETRQVTVHVGARELSYWSKSSRPRVPDHERPARAACRAF